MEHDVNPSHAADVVVIGGGLIGCAIAFRLAQARLRVVVFDRGQPGEEASQAAAGMLAPQGEMAEPSPLFPLCAASCDLYQQFIPEIEELSGERVAYHRDGSVLVATDHEECRRLEQIYRVQKGMGLELERLTRKDLLACVPALSPELDCGLFIPGDHWVDNQELTRLLVAACQRLGVTFRTGEPVTKLTVQKGRVESVEAGPDSSAARSRFYAGNYILAAGPWSRDLVAPLGINLPMQPCRGQIIEFESPKDLPLVVRSGLHYLVPRPQGRILAGTTAEYTGFDRAVTGEGLSSIIEGVSRFVPLVKQFRFRRAWAGLRPDTEDHMPILGYGEPENLIFATGHFRSGILLAPVTAKLVSELLLTRSTSLPIDTYAPNRFRRQKVTP